MKNSYIILLKQTWKFGLGKRGHLVLYYILFIIGNIIIMMQPVFLGLFLNTIQEAGPDMTFWIVVYLSIYALLNFVQWCFHGPARLIEQQFAVHVERQFALHAYEKLMELPLRWHKDHHSGETVSRIRKSGSALRSFVDDGFMYLETISRLVIGLGALLVINFVIGLFGLAMGLITVGIILLFDKRVVQLLNKYNDHEHTVHSLLFDYITNSITVLILRLEERTRTAVGKRYEGLMPHLRNFAITNEWKWFTVSMVVASLNFGALLYYCFSQLSLGGVILIGTLVALYQYLERYISQLFNFTWQYGQVTRQHTDFTSIDLIFDDHQKLISSTTDTPILKKWKTIDIQHLSFAYEDNKHHTHTLQDITLHLERGKRYAFVGESGSGKSTLLTLLRGIEEMDAGTVTIDGQEFSTTHVLAPISTLCPQDPEIFENTIAYNITVDVPHSKKDLHSLLEASRFTPVVQRLPKGLETDIKEKGVNLSGGEKQRLALARGLFAAKNSSLLLLDEPTSSVDPKNERAIYETIFELHKNSTIISSIHRLHLLAMFDHVYVFDNGKLTEQGSFEELKQSGTLFGQMWAHYQATLEK